MRKIAFGYSTRCNIRCAHCVAAGEKHDATRMELDTALLAIKQLAEAGVKGISFTAGEPLLFFEDLLLLLDACRGHSIYSRVVTNSFWAKSAEKAENYLSQMAGQGLCQLRLSYSRFHQQHVPGENIVHAAQAARKFGVDYFVSFVTDFSEEDDEYEAFLRENSLKFFPEPMIYAGRAGGLHKENIRTDYQENRCAMNPYLAPDLTMYACCDAGAHFTVTDFFKLGNLQEDSVEKLFSKTEHNLLYNCIRHIGISTIASYAGIPAREIITYRKCELCKKLFNSPETLKRLRGSVSDLQAWTR